VTGETTDLAALALKTQEVYERSAEIFDTLRDKSLFERGWLDRFLSLLPEHPAILDLGCGSAEPIAAYLIRCKARVTGLDASSAMIHLARTRYPKGDWRVADMRALDLTERFDGILGWDSFFHLTGDEQRALLPRMAGHLRPGGLLMLTVGPGDGEVGGHVGDDPVYHASLSIDEYGLLLDRAGMALLDFVAEDPGCHGRSVLLAQRAA
jgi:SAM-dependent methyltransferase